MPKIKEYYAHQARAARSDNLTTELVESNTKQYLTIRDKLLNDIKELAENSTNFCFNYFQDDELANLFIPQLIKDLKALQYEVSLTSSRSIMIHWNS